MKFDIDRLKEIIDTLARNRSTYQPVNHHL